MSGGSAQAAPYAAMVMDMRDGRVMHARGADRRQHPASLTKMMTLYLAFEAVEHGHINLGTRVRVSRKAAAQTGSRLRLRAGERVTIRDMIRATAIKSANDAAVVLAEAIGGSEKRFAQMMTSKARQLGMSSTTYRNPHGLTRSGHLTTARDQARLARHLFYDFPQYYNIFSRKTERAAGRRIWTTNRLLGTYRGIEGLKTGYTRAAGYNLVATAQRGSKRVIAVVMGGKSSRWRNARVAELLDMGFQRAKTRVAVHRPGQSAGVEVARAPLPLPRPGSQPTGLAALAAALSSPAHAAVDPSSRLAPTYAERPRQRGGAVDPARAGKPSRQPGMPIPPQRPGWAVVAGSYTDEAGAVARLAAIAGRRNLDLGDTESVIAQRRSGSGATVYDVRFEGFSKAEATAVCKTLGRLCRTEAPDRLSPGR
ncbi:MAG: D-alanyl-D-alanine carboxypeptidase family protein [Pseudomonadota bacterium]